MYRFNYKMIAATIGALLLIVSLMMLAVMGVAIYFKEDWASMFLASGITAVTGFLLCLANWKNKARDVSKRDGFIIVAFGWVSMSLLGSLPFIFSGSIPNIIDAVFETVSGFSTTGATILTDIESQAHYILAWRSMTHWIGGMGIIVLTVAILPLLGVGGMQLFKAEAPGLSPDKLHPRITGTAKRLWFLYLLLTLAESIALYVAGMDLFDAVNHAMATMATGGFSTKNASIAYYTSPTIHYIIMFFMFLAGVNFTMLFFGFTGKFKNILQSEELKVYAYNTLIFGSIISIVLIFSQDTPIETAIRNGFFTVVSIMTTTGFITDNYLNWPNFLIFIVFILFFSGGSTGSTSGGIKIMRHIILIKNSFLELKRQIHPNAVIPVRFNYHAVPQNITNTVSAFVLIWLIVFFISTFIMSMFGLDFMSAVGSVTATLGNIGPGLGSVGPIDNFAHIPPGAKLFLSFLMLLGRLELFTVLILFMPFFWRKR
jgi:trk system potassium uptake protein TrkH